MAKKLWSKAIEESGLSVRLFERAKGGPISMSVVLGRGTDQHGNPKTEKYVKSTGLKNRAEAEAAARGIAQGVARIQINGNDLRSLTLGQLLEKFFDLKAPSYTDRWKKHAQTRRNLFLAAWGASKRVEDLGQSDVDHYAHLRRTGKISSETSRVKKVRDGTIEADLRWLSTVFRWARGYKVGGKPLVPSNPLEGVDRPKEANPRRPVASHDRFLKTQVKCNEVDPEGRLRCMLALARYGGRRENAICQLRADDILWTQGAVRDELARMGLDEGDAEFYPEGGIRWRAESDKMGVHSISPLSGVAREELEQYLAGSPRIGDVPLFPAPKDPEAPMRVDVAGRWLRKAEKLAGLPPLSGGIWHPYRRLFAIQNKALPIHDVAAAGGWSSVETVQRIYQKPEAKGVLKVMQNTGKGA